MTYNLLGMMDKLDTFETIVDGHTAFAAYDLGADFIVFLHTEVPQALAGRGIAQQLVRTGLEHAREYRRGEVRLAGGHQPVAEHAQQVPVLEVDLGQVGEHADRELRQAALGQELRDVEVVAGIRLVVVAQVEIDPVEIARVREPQPRQVGRIGLPGAQARKLSKRETIVGKARRGRRAFHRLPDRLPRRRGDLNRLRKELARAVESEDYERAAKLRDQIRATEDAADTIK